MSAINLTESPEQIVVDMINASNGTSLTVGMLSFSFPTATGGSTGNTQVVATATEAAAFTGSRILNYNRIDLSTVPGSAPTIFEIGNAVNIADLIPAINAAYGINLLTGDFVNAALPTLPTTTVTSATFNVVADASSLVYIGQMTLTVTNGNMPLSSIITTTSLGSIPFTPPT